VLKDLLVFKELQERKEILGRKVQQDQVLQGRKDLLVFKELQAHKDQV
jgi:hypothetical protein